ncbi:MAG: ABC transporter ATP-binding protein, partial [Saprospiraceae bacterium]
MMIHFKNVRKQYGNKIALSIHELIIWEGESIGLVGNNGAGKTTLLSLMLDLIKATSGQVFSKDLAVHKSDHWKSYTGSYLDEGFLISYLTPIEFLEFAAALHGYNKVQVAQFLSEATDFFNESYWNVGYIRTLSAGNKAKVGILASLIIKPELIILDEPFAFLDPSSQAWLVKKLKALNAA